jgi:hypothetical protein
MLDDDHQDYLNDQSQCDPSLMADGNMPFPIVFDGSKIKQSSLRKKEWEQHILDSIPLYPANEDKLRN